jgi:hypothetical protein
MKTLRLHLLTSLTLLGLFLLGCNNEDGDKEKIVEMTVYSETGYAPILMSENLWGEFFYVSESDDNEKKVLANTITEGFGDFDYEKGYEYTLRVKKIWMDPAPQDVSSIKYMYLEMLSSNKVINEDSENEIAITVDFEKVQFLPRTSSQQYQAMLIKEAETDRWKPVIEIEGFEYEPGYEYTLRVKKIITAQPYTVTYVLVSILSKELKS